MVYTTFMEPVAKGFLLVTNILSTVRIDKLVVPEVIASDGSAVLECVYSGAGDDVTVMWLLNGYKVYSWIEGTEPIISGVLEKRIDLSHRTSNLHPVQRRTMRLIELTPEMSGNYTCVVQSRGQEARESKNMIVFSPEQEFELSFSRISQGVLNIKCIAKHLYPQPDLTIEYNKIVISQQQRIWRIESYYDAECTAVLAIRDIASQEVACRLQIPQVDYTVITKKIITGNEKSGSHSSIGLPIYLIVVWIIINQFAVNFD